MIVIETLDEDPPVCAGCQHPLEQLRLGIVLTGSTTTTIDGGIVTWRREVGGYVVIPSLLRWVSEGFGALASTCPACAHPAPMQLGGALYGSDIPHMIVPARDEGAAPTDDRQAAE